MGPETAPMTVVFFSAFGCGTCTTFKDAPQKLVEKYGDKVRIVFKHKIIPEPAPDSLAASVAALAAKEQGKFWEYHDKLFETNALDPASLTAHASALGLNLKKFVPMFLEVKFEVSIGMSPQERGFHMSKDLLKKEN